MEYTAEQNRAIHEIEHNLQIIACAGSGKTEVITRRIAYILTHKPEIRPENIVAFTFTEKAAASLKERIYTAAREERYENPALIENMYIGTIHGFCRHILNDYCGKFTDIRPLNEQETHHFIRKYSKYCGLEELELTTRYEDVRIFTDCISKMADDYDNRDNWTEAQRKAFSMYRSCLHEKGFFDYSMQIFEAAQQMKKDPVLQQYLCSIRYLVVDEYQDVDDLQEQLIELIAHAGANICVVGDDDQTIYQFRGSNAEHIIHFAEKYPDVVKVNLDINFRCNSSIVRYADQVIRHNTNRLEKNMKSSAPEVTAAGTMPDGEKPVQFIGCPSWQEEQADICREIRKLHLEGMPYEKIAVLSRKGKYIPELAETMRRNGIPCAASSNAGVFDGIYYKKFLATLEAMKKVNLDGVAFNQIWSDIIDDRKALRQGFKYIRSKADINGREHLLLKVIIGEMLETMHFYENGDEENKRYQFQGFGIMADDFDTIYLHHAINYRIDQFLETVKEPWGPREYKYVDFGRPESSTDESQVQLMTIHKSKGLEFDAVFIIQMIEGEFPSRQMGGKSCWTVLGSTVSNKQKYQSNVDDERKLFYVATTRAARKVWITWESGKQKSQLI